MTKIFLCLQLLKWNILLYGEHLCHWCTHHNLSWFSDFISVSFPFSVLASPKKLKGWLQLLAAESSLTSLQLSCWSITSLPFLELAVYYCVYNISPLDHPEPNESSPHPTSFRYILILSSHLCLNLPSGLLTSVFLTKTLYCFSSLPCLLHTQPMSSSLISPFLIKNTNYDS